MSHNIAIHNSYIHGQATTTVVPNCQGLYLRLLPVDIYRMFLKSAGSVIPNNTETKLGIQSSFAFASFIFLTIYPSTAPPCAMIATDINGFRKFLPDSIVDVKLQFVNSIKDTKSSLVIHTSLDAKQLVQWNNKNELQCRKKWWLSTCCTFLSKKISNLAVTSPISKAHLPQATQVRKYVMLTLSCRGTRHRNSWRPGCLSCCSIYYGNHSCRDLRLCSSISDFYYCRKHSCISADYSAE